VSGSDPLFLFLQSEAGDAGAVLSVDVVNVTEVWPQEERGGLGQGDLSSAPQSRLKKRNTVPAARAGENVYTQAGLQEKGLVHVLEKWRRTEIHQRTAVTPRGSKAQIGPNGGIRSEEKGKAAMNPDPPVLVKCRGTALTISPTSAENKGTRGGSLGCGLG